ncbi:MAG: alpha/beta hydrolase [Myxococcota bacterium]
MMFVDRLKRYAVKTTISLPNLAKHRLFGAPPENDRGARLDLDTWTLLQLEKRVTPPRPSSVEDIRENTRRSASIVGIDPAPEPARIMNLLLAERVPARLYIPPHHTAPGPGMVFMHGGGWTICDLDTHDGFCRRVCVETGTVVISVDYRLAPESPFPAGYDDTLAAWRDVVARADEMEVDPEMLMIGGDSAGGNLAAAACIALRDAGEPLPWRQLLIYPCVEMADTHDSRETFAEGYFLTLAQIKWYQTQYAGPEYDPRVSPLRADDHAGLPAAIVVTAGFDPLRDEGESYIARLRAAGVPVEHLDAADLIHGFINMDGLLPAADREVQRILTVLRSLNGAMA